MIRINLLPHREAARKARREQFYMLAGLVGALGCVIVFAGYTLIGGYVAAQEDANAYLKSEVAMLDKQLEEIKGLKEQTRALLSRKQVIENLQKDRGETVHLLAELVRQVPEGVYLKSLKQDGLKIDIGGFAQSNARVSALMRNLEASPWLGNPQLVEVKAVTQNGRRLNEFSMNFTITRSEPEEAKGKK